MDAVLDSFHDFVSKQRRSSKRRRRQQAERKSRSFVRLQGESLEGRELLSGTPTSEWASKVVAFSSQYDTSAYSAAQALGAPNVTSYGDNREAWCPKNQNGTTESLTVGYATPIYANGITVRESSGNGFVTKLELRNAATGAYETVWQGTDSTAQGTPGDLKVAFAQRSYLVDAVRVTTNTSQSTTWEEVDAVQLSGVTADAPATTTSVTATFQDGVNGYAGTTDTHIRSATATTNYGTSTTMYGSNVSGSLMKWDVSKIPTNAVVQSAKLTLNVTDPSASSYELYQLKRNWSEASATWNNASTGTPWEVAGAKGATDRGSTVLGSITASTTGEKVITLNAAGVAAVQAWINNPSSNFGLVLQDYTGTDGMAFQSSESTTVTARPKLEITYGAGSTTLNKAPTVNAGVDKSATLAAGVSLDGTVSDDGLPNPPGTVKTTWTKVSGPGTVTFANAAAVDTTASFSTAGTYVLRLTGSDGTLSASDDATITAGSTSTTNQAPVVSAGANQTITLPGTATLAGTVKDDGLPNPPAATTATWSLASGPTGGTVSFANAKSASTTASFSTAGTYVLKLTASDGQLSSSATTTITVNPVSTPTGTSTGIWMTKAEIMALPTSGAAWDTLVKAAANDTSKPNLANIDDYTEVNALAKAIVGIRTGNQAMIDQARTSVMAAIGTEKGGDSLGPARLLAPLVSTANLVGLSATQDTQFRSWLSQVRTETYSDGMSIVSDDEKRANNYGAMAGASRIAIDLYLGDKTDLARAVQVFKGWLGDTSAYTGFSFGGPDDDLSWQPDPNHPLAILPVGATLNGHSVSGLMPEEMRRGDTYQWPPVPTTYVWQSLQGAFVQAEMLYRAGYNSGTNNVYSWSNNALLRATKFAYSLGDQYDPEWYPTTGTSQWLPPLINARYGTNYPENASAPAGKIMGWTAWSTQNLAPAASSTTSVMAAPTTQSLTTNSTSSPVAPTLELAPQTSSQTVSSPAVGTPVTDSSTTSSPAVGSTTPSTAVDQVFATTPQADPLTSVTPTNQTSDWSVSSSLADELVALLTQQRNR